MTDTIGKKALRLKYLQKREALSEAKYLQDSQSICDCFFAHINLVTVHNLNIFLPLFLKKEPNTELIIRGFKKKFPHIRISVPKIQFETNMLTPIYYEGQQLQKNKWDIMEPDVGTLTPVEEIDVVIVPLLAFDTRGHRIGYGKGYYDVFLASCRLDCKKIGLSFFPPIEKIPAESWDIPISCCVTPKQVYWFNKTPNQ